MNLTNAIASANAFVKNKPSSGHEITSIAQLQETLDSQKKAFREDNFPSLGQRILDLAAKTTAA